MAAITGTGTMGDMGITGMAITGTVTMVGVAAGLIIAGVTAKPN